MGERTKYIIIKTHFDDDDDRDGVVVKCPYCKREEVMTDGSTVYMLRMRRKEETYVSFDSDFMDQEDEPNLWYDWNEADTTESGLHCNHCNAEVLWPGQVEHA